MCAHLTALQVDNVSICDVEAVDGILGLSLREVDSTSSASRAFIEVPDPLSAQQVRPCLTPLSAETCKAGWFGGLRVWDLGRRCHVPMCRPSELAGSGADPQSRSGVLCDEAGV